MDWSLIGGIAVCVTAAGMWFISALLSSEYGRKAGLRQIQRYYQLERMARRRDTKALGRFMERYADDLEYLQGYTPEQVAQLLRQTRLRRTI